MARDEDKWPMPCLCTCPTACRDQAAETYALDPDMAAKLRCRGGKRVGSSAPAVLHACTECSRRHMLARQPPAPLPTLRP